jgi:hypothetical protein
MELCWNLASLENEVIFCYVMFDFKGTFMFYAI